MALRPSVLVSGQPYKQRAEGCSYFKLIDAKLLEEGMLNVYTTSCPGGIDVWKQVVLVESNVAVSYFFADFLKKAQDRVAKDVDPVVFVNNFLAEWQKVKDKEEFKLLTTAVNIILEGEISINIRKYPIRLPSLTVITDPKLVGMAVRAFYNRVVELKDRLDLKSEVLVRVFCECPFFKYWGPYYLSNQRTFGLLAEEASRLLGKVGISHKEFVRYDHTRGRERRVISTIRGVRYVNPMRLFVNKYRGGILWNRFDVCKHLYKVLDGEQYRLKESFRIIAERLARQFENLVEAITKIYLGLKESIDLSLFNQLLEYNISCLLNTEQFMGAQKDKILLRYLFK